MRLALSALVICLLGFCGLAACAGGDAGYTARVLIRQNAGTEDYLWKDSRTIMPSPRPSALDVSLDAAPIRAAFEADPDCANLERYLKDSGAIAFLVYRDGAIRYEWYGNGGAVDKPAAAFSVSKSVFSLLLARAVEQGVLPGLDVPVTTYLPELAQRDERFASITLRQLLDMRSGLAFDDTPSFPWVNQDAPAVYYATDLVKTVLRRARIVSPPGPFLYNDYAPNLNGLALQRASGDRLPAGAMQELWNELGAEYPALWSVDSKGFAWHESGFVVTGRDLVRFGRLVLDAGHSGGDAVAPQAWLDAMPSSATEPPAIRFGATDMWYRNGWWSRPHEDGADDLVAMGNFGQIVLVSPATGTVIVRLGRDGHRETNVALVERFRRAIDRLSSP